MLQVELSDPKLTRAQGRPGLWAWVLKHSPSQNRAQCQLQCRKGVLYWVRELRWALFELLGPHLSFQNWPDGPAFLVITTAWSTPEVCFEAGCQSLKLVNLTHRQTSSLTLFWLRGPHRSRHPVCSSTIIPCLRCKKIGQPEIELGKWRQRGHNLLSRFHF